MSTNNNNNNNSNDIELTKLFTISDEISINIINPSIWLISINRPNHRNAVNPIIANQLYQAFLLFESNIDAKVAILYGIGGNFCAGYDLIYTANNPQSIQYNNNNTINTGVSIDNNNNSIKNNLLPVSESNLGPMGPTRLLLTKPVIAAISGYCVAGGLELSLWCDIRIADSTAILGIYCRKYGVPLIDGGTVRLPRLIGLSRSMDLILTGRSVNADEAYSIGLINKLVSNNDNNSKYSVLYASIDYANSIIHYPQLALKTDRLSAINSFNNNNSTVNSALESEFESAQSALKFDVINGAKQFKLNKGKSINNSNSNINNNNNNYNINNWKKVPIININKQNIINSNL